MDEVPGLAVRAVGTLLVWLFTIAPPKFRHGRLTQTSAMLSLEFEAFAEIW